MSRKLTPIRCTPQYYHKIWGGGHLAPTGGDKQIGEAWLLSALIGQETPTEGADYEGASLDALVSRYGDRLLGQGQTVRCGGVFPLLIKLLDAAADLSVQVHPSPEEGGKDEVWYFLETEPTSRICLGLTELMTADALRSVIERGDLMHYLHWEPVRPGEAIALPAGTIHALGAGSMLIEVQDTSDTTYRLYDYDRVDDEGARRTLHIEEALRSATLGPHKLASRQLPLGTPRFVCHEVTAKPNSSQLITTDGTSCAILVGISGSLTLTCDDTEPWQLAPHEALLIPAETLPIRIAPGEGKALMITLTPAER